ncbi:cytochrome P450 [Nocardia brasiliensis]|uniref:cytochrome P450 n=1 Tax=Nocardia brasiliensis TaxID=37326 RepID=UPI003D8EFB50
MEAVLDRIPADLIQRPDPHQWFDQVRKVGQVCRIEDMNGQRAWLIIGHAGAREALASKVLSSDASRVATAPEAVNDRVCRRSFSASLFATDPPAHTRLRRAVTASFAPQFLRTFHPIIEKSATQLMEQIQGRNEIDLVADFAAPFATMNICAFLGIPLTDHRAVLDWSRQLLTTPIDEASVRISRTAGEELDHYLTELFHGNRRPTAGLIGRWLADESPERLTEDELRSTTTFMIVAGHQTSIGLQSACMLHLLCNPERYRALRADPRLLSSAVEEIIRFDGPTVLLLRRFALTDTQFDGVPIPKGGQVIVSTGAANRDPAVFTRPGEIVIDRAPNPHLGFGYGVHYCPGVGLAVDEACTALSLLIESVPGFRLAVPRDHLSWQPLKIRCLSELPVHLAA